MNIFYILYINIPSANINTFYIIMLNIIQIIILFLLRLLIIYGCYGCYYFKNAVCVMFNSYIL